MSVRGIGGPIPDKDSVRPLDLSSISPTPEGSDVPSTPLQSETSQQPLAYRPALMGRVWGVFTYTASKASEAAGNVAYHAAQGVYYSLKAVHDQGFKTAVTEAVFDAGSAVASTARNTAATIGQKASDIAEGVRIDLEGFVGQIQDDFQQQREDIAAVAKHTVQQVVLPEMDQRRIDDLSKAPQLTTTTRTAATVAAQRITNTIQYKKDKKLKEHTWIKPVADAIVDDGSNLNDYIKANLLKALSNFSGKVGEIEATRPGFMRNLGGRLVENYLERATPGADPQLNDPQIFAKTMADEILRLTFPGGAKDLELPDSVLGSLSREAIWNKLHDEILPKALVSVFKKAFSVDTRNKLVLKALEKIDKKSKKVPIPREELGALTDAGRAVLDNFMQCFPDVAKGILGSSLVQKKAVNIIAHAMHKQFRKVLSKEIDKLLVKQMHVLHPGEWVIDPKTGEKIEFSPTEWERDSVTGAPIKDPVTGKFNVVIDDKTGKPKINPRRWAPANAEQVTAKKQRKADKVTKRSDKLNDKMDALFQRKTVQFALAHTSEHKVGLLLTVLAFATCCLSIIGGFYILANAERRNRIYNYFNAALIQHAQTTKKQMIDALHDKRHDVLFRRVALTTIRALNAPRAVEPPVTSTLDRLSGPKLHRRSVVRIAAPPAAAA